MARRARGPLVLDRFGGGELEGWPATQFIGTTLTPRALRR
jgi:hypothetical protein